MTAFLRRFAQSHVGFQGPEQSSRCGPESKNITSAPCWFPFGVQVRLIGLRSIWTQTGDLRGQAQGPDDRLCCGSEIQLFPSLSGKHIQTTSDSVRVFSPRGRVTHEPSHTIRPRGPTNPFVRVTRAHSSRIQYQTKTTTKRPMYIPSILSIWTLAACRHLPRVREANGLSSRVHLALS